VKYVDRVLQRWRIRKAAAFIKRGDSVLDIGSADGALFRMVPGLGPSVGIEPELEPDRVSALPNVNFYKGYFPAALPGPMNFDAITMLAVLEHVPYQEQESLARACASHLKPGGRLIITVPSQAVDHVLAVLKRLGLIDGMSLHQHYGFEASQTPKIFQPFGLRLIAARRFQLGLNNLFVFGRD
jgi:2-polyprenyl-3-methyl-5-hydroxy-6-metoxy-1,4-benzoquinol methylase